MITAGIDIGSRTVKLAVMEGGRLSGWRVENHSHDPLEICERLLSTANFDRLATTGYGRHLFARYHPCEIMTEIRAVAAGCRHVFPGCRTILDLGGQDIKAVSLGVSGSAGKFEMNDKCAAGTGRFLEIMAAALGFSMQDFIEAALHAGKSQKINAMCTVFAESEVVSMAARGIPRGEIALGIHQAIAQRAAAMVRRIPLENDIVFCGGGALNACLKRCIERELGTAILADENPQLMAAMGAALLIQK